MRFPPKGGTPLLGRRPPRAARLHLVRWTSPPQASSSPHAHSRSNRSRASDGAPPSRNCSARSLLFARGGFGLTTLFRVARVERMSVFFMEHLRVRGLSGVHSSATPGGGWWRRNSLK
jgi:hypothetical protein